MAYEAFWTFISYFADIAYWIGFGVSFLVIYPLLDRKDKAKVSWVLYALLPAALLSYLAVFVLKNTLAIPRPCQGLSYCPNEYSFPSGHAAIISTFAATVILYERKYRSYLWAVPLAILVGVSRIMLNFHTVMDVTGGFAVGILFSVAVYFLSEKIENILRYIKII